MTLLLIQVLSVLTSTHDVRALAEHDGALWVGTTGGLVRVRGDERRVFTPLDGLPDGTVRALFSDAGDLWAGTDRGAVRVRFTDGALIVGDVVGAGLRVEALARHAGVLYLGTTTGLFAFDADVLRALDGDDHVSALASTPAGLYVATVGHGTYRVTPSGRHRLRGDLLAWALAVRGDEVWVATSRGVDRYMGERRHQDALTRASRLLPVADVRALHFEDDALVVGTLGAGAFRWDGRAFTPLAEVPHTARVQALGGDAVGTDQGLIGTHEVGLPDNDLSALARTREGVWVGTFRHGLACIHADGHVTRFGEADGLVDERINRLAVDAEGDLWVATDRGVVERTAGAFHLRGLLDRHVFALGFVDGAVHAGAGDHAFRFEGRDFERIDQPGVRPQDFAMAGRSLLVASAEGLARNDTGTWSLTQAGNDTALPDDWITAVAARHGDVFVGTYDAGVARVRDGEIEALLPDLWVNAGALVALHHGLAVGTLDDGLWLERDGEWQTLRTSEGLPDDDVTAILPAGDGTLYVATRGGLAHVRVAP